MDVFGTDYDTPDGTCVRDYIHVSDLVAGPSRCARAICATAARAASSIAAMAGLFGARGHQGGREGAPGASSMSSALARAAPAIRRRSSRAPTRSRAVLGWEPRHEDLDGIVAERARLGRTPAPAQRGLNEAAFGGFSARHWRLSNDSAVRLTTRRCSNRMMRRHFVAALPSAAAGGHAGPAPMPKFVAFIQNLWPRAKAAGISRELFDRGLRRHHRSRSRSCSSSPTTSRNSPRRPPQYLAKAVTPIRIETGQGDEGERRPKAAGGDREALRRRPPHPARHLGHGEQFRQGQGLDEGDALARHACSIPAARRIMRASRYIAALKILKQGVVTPENFTGSWAGAMGHTQFIPTSYLVLCGRLDRRRQEGHLEFEGRMRSPRPPIISPRRDGRPTGHGAGR